MSVKIKIERESDREIDFESFSQSPKKTLVCFSLFALFAFRFSRARARKQMHMYTLRERERERERDFERES